MDTSFYPNIQIGDPVMHANDPKAPPSQWAYGIVAVTKNVSCDIVVFTRGGTRYFSDCFFFKDPRCETTREWISTNRGVFQLTDAEIQRRRFINNIAALDQRLRLLEQSMEELAMQQAKQAVAKKPQHALAER